MTGWRDLLQEDTQLIDIKGKLSTFQLLFELRKAN